jgi:hypothetical protein
MQTSTRAWALDEFGRAQLGDRRRVSRLVAIADDLARSPASVVANALRDDAARQAAYDFLEGGRVLSSAIEDAAARSCAERASAHPFVFVPVDGTAISLTDPARKKQIGPLGSADEGRGLKVVSAIALSPDGVSLGLAGQQYWVRDERRYASHAERKRADRRRPREERETQHWVTIIKRVDARLRDAKAKPWWVIDREGDAQAIFDALLATEGFFTVRANHDRNVTKAQEKREVGQRPRPFLRQRHLRTEMGRRRPIGTYEIDLTATPKRRARRAKLVVSARRLTLRQRVNGARKTDMVPLNVVWLREVGTTPMGDKPLDWMLYTNHPINTAEDIDLVVHSYTKRWPIEEFHKTWKSGGCDVERTALRGTEALKKWATILAAVAARIERLKQLSRKEPDRPATHELSKYELQALLFLKRGEKKRTETIVDNPSIALATRWIADLGGYTGTSSGGPPGAITIGRGLERVLAAAKVFEGIELGEV